MQQGYRESCALHRSPAPKNVEEAEACWLLLLHSRVPDRQRSAASKMRPSIMTPSRRLLPSIAFERHLNLQFRALAARRARSPFYCAD